MHDECTRMIDNTFYVDNLIVTDDDAGELVHAN